MPSLGRPRAMGHTHGGRETALMVEQLHLDLTSSKKSILIWMQDKIYKQFAPSTDRRRIRFELLRPVNNIVEDACRETISEAFDMELYND